MKTCEQIYKDIYKREFTFRTFKGYDSDRASRLANLSAVKYTITKWQQQYKDNK